MRIIEIYDYKNDASYCVVEDKEIKEIEVFIFSGDEVVTFIFEDGTRQRCDSSDCRITSYYDGDYIVAKDYVTACINFVPSGKEAASYERYDWFKELMFNECD